MFCAPITFYNTLKRTLGGGEGKQPPCLRFLQYFQNFICAQNMLIYFRLHCVLYIFNRGVDGSQANLLKKVLHGVNVKKEHRIERLVCSKGFVVQVKLILAFSRFTLQVVARNDASTRTCVYNTNAGRSSC